MQSVVLARRPEGNPRETDFKVVETPLPPVTEEYFFDQESFYFIGCGFS